MPGKGGRLGPKAPTPAAMITARACTTVPLEVVTFQNPPLNGSRPCTCSPR